MCNIGVERLVVEFEPLSEERLAEPADEQPGRQEPVVPVVGAPEPVTVPA
jgi:hypothetical protein